MATINHREFFGLLKQMPGANKEDVVWQYSNGFTQSLSTFANCDPQGYRRMLIDLRKAVKTDADRQTKKLRSAILHRLQKHGVDTTDWDKVNRFLEQPRIAGKRLYDMSNDEMKALIPKMESILGKDKVERERIKRITTQN